LCKSGIYYDYNMYMLAYEKSVKFTMLKLFLKVTHYNIMARKIFLSKLLFIIVFELWVKIGTIYNALLI